MLISINRHGSRIRSASLLKDDEWQAIAIDFQRKFENFRPSTNVVALSRVSIGALQPHAGYSQDEKQKKNQHRGALIPVSPKKWYNKIGKLYCISERRACVGKRVYKYLYRVDGFVYKWQLLRVRAVRTRIRKIAEIEGFSVKNKTKTHLALRIFIRRQENKSNSCGARDVYALSKLIMSLLFSRSKHLIIHFERLDSLVIPENHWHIYTFTGISLVPTRELGWNKTRFLFFARYWFISK